MHQVCEYRQVSLEIAKLLSPIPIMHGLLRGNQRWDGPAIAEPRGVDEAESSRSAMYILGLYASSFSSESATRTNRTIPRHAAGIYATFVFALVLQSQYGTHAIEGRVCADSRGDCEHRVKNRHELSSPLE